MSECTCHKNYTLDTLYALPASAMISKIMTQDTAYSVTAAGIPVCTLTLQ